MFPRSQGSALGMQSVERYSNSLASSHDVFASSLRSFSSFRSFLRYPTSVSMQS